MSAPIDLTATGTQLAGWLSGAAAAGVVVLGALYGLRVIVESFYESSGEPEQRYGAPERHDDSVPHSRRTFREDSF